MVEQNERLAKVETEVKNLKEVNTKEHKQLFDKLDLQFEKIDKFIDSADTKYAGKIVERIVYGLVATILTFVLTAILTKSLNVW